MKILEANNVDLPVTYEYVFVMESSEKLKQISHVWNNSKI